MFWFRKKAERPEPSKAAKDVAYSFRNGALDFVEINAQGISRMAIMFRGSRIEVTWYSLGAFRSVRIDDTSSFGSTIDAEYVKEAAVWRARHLLDEKLRQLGDNL